MREILRRCESKWKHGTAGKFYGWRESYGKVNEHNGWVAGDFWLEEWEKQAIVAFYLKNPLEGYRQADVHDAGRRHRGGESGQRVACAESSGTAAKVEREALKKGDRL